jgi:hypothetical protein
VRVNTRNGYSVDRSLGELIEAAAGKVADDKFDMMEADVCLRRIGMAYETRGDVAGFWIARHKTYIANTVMRASQFPQGWGLVLKKHPQATMSDRQISFGGYKQYAIWLPYPCLMGDQVAALKVGEEE